MYFSKSMWMLIRMAYYRKRAPYFLIQALRREVSTVIPWCFKKKRFLFAQENTNLYTVRISSNETAMIRLYRYRYISLKIIGYPIHKFGFFHRKTGWSSRWRFKKKIKKKKFDRKNIGKRKKIKKKLKRLEKKLKKKQLKEKKKKI